MNDTASACAALASPYPPPRTPPPAHAAPWASCAAPGARSRRRQSPPRPRARCGRPRRGASPPLGSPRTAQTPRAGRGSLRGHRGGGALRGAPRVRMLPRHARAAAREQGSHAARRSAARRGARLNARSSRASGLRRAAATSQPAASSRRVASRMQPFRCACSSALGRAAQKASSAASGSRRASPPPAPPAASTPSGVDSAPMLAPVMSLVACRPREAGEKGQSGPGLWMDHGTRPARQLPAGTGLCVFGTATSRTGSLERAPSRRGAGEEAGGGARRRVERPIYARGPSLRPSLWAAAARVLVAQPAPLPCTLSVLRAAALLTRARRNGLTRRAQGVRHDCCPAAAFRAPRAQPPAAASGGGGAR